MPMMGRCCCCQLEIKEASVSGSWNAFAGGFGGPDGNVIVDPHVTVWEKFRHRDVFTESGEWREMILYWHPFVHAVFPIAPPGGFYANGTYDPWTYSSSRDNFEAAHAALLAHYASDYSGSTFSGTRSDDEWHIIQSTLVPAGLVVGEKHYYLEEPIHVDLSNPPIFARLQAVLDSFNDWDSLPNFYTALPDGEGGFGQLDRLNAGDSNGPWSARSACKSFDDPLIFEKPDGTHQMVLLQWAVLDDHFAGGGSYPSITPPMFGAMAKVHFKCLPQICTGLFDSSVYTCGGVQPFSPGVCGPLVSGDFILAPPTTLGIIQVPAFNTSLCDGC